MRKKTRSLSTRLVVLFTVFLILSTLTVGTISYFLNRDSAIDMNAERALGIARTVVSAIDVEQYKATIEAGQETPYWRWVKDYLDDVITDNNLIYLYILYEYDEQNEEVVYFAEGMVDGDTAVELVFNDTETIDNYDTRTLDVFGGVEAVSDNFYSAEEWGYMISGMAPIIDAQGNVVGIVGADVEVNEVLERADQFGLLILLLVVGISLIMSTFMAIYLRQKLGRPIAELTDVAQKIARGQTDVAINAQSNTEVGALADSFRDMIDTITQQVTTLTAIAEGDLSVHVVPKSPDDRMSHALVNTIDRLNDMLSQINRLTRRVTDESGKIALSAQSVARGAASQASAVEQLSSSITEISIQTQQNADLADRSAKLASTIKTDATHSFNQMKKLIESVKAIDKAANSIRYVMKIIEDIALQTNILSLNASVEAAHAGENGKGFIVVAKEVQSLSKKTSESAKETAALVTDTLEKTKQGVKIAEEAHVTIMNVVNNIIESDRIVGEIAMSSKEQMIAIEQVNQGIGQVAMVVHQSSASAEESAGVVEKMNQQAMSLADEVARFKTKE